MPVLNDWSRVGDRVRTARVASGRSQIDLANVIGVDRTAIGRIEGGDRRLTLLEAAAVAGELSVDVSLLLAEPTPAITSHRRSPADESQPEQRAARAALVVEQHAADTAWLIHRGYLAGGSNAARYARQSRRLAAADVEAMARESRRQAGVQGVDPVGDLADVAETLEIYLRGVDEDIEGASLYAGDWAVAVVGARLEPGRRRMTAAHEIGHQVLGDEYSVDLGVSTSTDRRERVIDRFAGEFLIPGAVVAARLSGADAGSMVDILIRIAAEYRVSWRAVVQRGLDVNAVPGRRRQELLERSPTRGDLIRIVGREVPADLTPGSTGRRWTAAVLDAYAAGDLGKQRALRLLGGRFSEQDLPRREDDDLW